MVIDIKNKSTIIKDRLIELLGESWYDKLSGEFNKPYMGRISRKIVEERKLYNVFPTNDDVFNAYKLTPFNKVKVVIIGQDPYPTKGEAHGLAFSTKKGTFTPSLRKIADAVRSEIYLNSSEYVWFNNLERWANQGVLLLNYILTVREGFPNSHRSFGWELFTRQTIKLLDEEGDKVFLLWGTEARLLRSSIKNSLVVECEHPAAAAYANRDWDNKSCFLKANRLIKDPEILW